MSFLNPNEILNKLKLKPNLVAVDFGAGSGGWVIPLAKILVEGTVYAVDLLEEPLSVLKSKLKRERLFNIKTILANVEDGVAELKTAGCDLVLMTNLLFQVEDQVGVFKEAKRVLNEKGKILVVDWEKDNPFTAQVEKVSFSKIKEIAADLGFKVEEEFAIKPYHFAILFTL